MNITTNRATRLATLTSTAFLLSVASALAEPIAYEGFDIDASADLDFAEGANSFGWAEEWFSFDGEDVVHAISDTGLTYGELATVGNSFVFENEANFNATATYRMLPTMYQAGSTSGTIWLSALMQPMIDGDPAEGGFFQLILSDGADPYNKGYIGTDWAGEQYSAGGERIVDNGLSDQNIVSGETALLVVALDFDNLTMSFWVNPDPAAETLEGPVATLAMENEGNSVFRFDRVGLWVGNYGPASEDPGADFTGTHVDEIRLGETWADVSPLGDGGGEPGPVTWAGFEVEQGTGWVFTNETYLGWLWVGETADQDWVYSHALGTYLYLPESHVMAEGAWAYTVDLDTWDVRSGYAPWLAVDALNTWVYVPGYSDTTTATWAYVVNSTDVVQ